MDTTDELKSIQKWIILNIENLCEVSVPIQINDLTSHDGDYERLIHGLDDTDIIDESYIDCKICQKEFDFHDDGSLPIAEIIAHAREHIAKNEMSVCNGKVKKTRKKKT